MKTSEKIWSGCSQIKVKTCVEKPNNASFRCRRTLRLLAPLRPHPGKPGAPIGVVLERGGVADDNQAAPRPGDGDIEAPLVLQEPQLPLVVAAVARVGHGAIMEPQSLQQEQGSTAVGPHFSRRTSEQWRR